MTEFKLSDEELESGIVFVKSDVYPDANRAGVFLWVAKHPGSGWSESGQGASHEHCVEQINATLSALLGCSADGGTEVDGGVAVMRTFAGDALTEARIVLVPADRQIIACRPADLDLDDPLDRTIAAQTFVYEGSIEVSCELCGRKVWMGPRQQAVARAGAHEVRCLTCACVALAASGGGEVSSLGNPQPRPAPVDPVQAAVMAALRRAADRFPGVEGLLYRGPADFVAQHGAFYTMILDRPLVPGHCFGNSIFAASVGAGIQYVEGFVLRPDGAGLVHHAWVAMDGTGHEVTWPALGLAYIGCEFSVGRADDCTWNGDATVLDDFKRGWPLLRQRWEGEPAGQAWPDNDRLRLLRLVAEGKATIDDYNAVLEDMAQGDD